MYVGPLTRYHLSDWQTIVQQAGAASGMTVEVIRANPDPENSITDSASVLSAVREWQGTIGAILNASADWEEGVELSYWTDKPDWDGYGALVLAAAYVEEPQLAPGARRGFLRGPVPDVSCRAFGDAPAVRRARSHPRRFPSLLGGVEWWLPVRGTPKVFEAARPGGRPARMANVDQLLAELELLNRETIDLSEATARRAREAGPPAPGSPMEQVLPFGLSVFMSLASEAARRRQPLLLDY